MLDFFLIFQFSLNLYGNLIYTHFSEYFTLDNHNKNNDGFVHHIFIFKWY